MAWPTDTDRLVVLLNSRYAQIRNPEGLTGLAGTQRAFWRVILNYSLLFYEEPVLKSLAVEMDQLARDHDSPKRLADQTALTAMGDAAAFLKSLAVGDPSIDDVEALDAHVEPRRLAQALQSLAVRLQTRAPDTFPAQEWSPVHAGLKLAVAAHNEAMNRHALVTFSRPWEAWRVVSEIGDAPNWVGDALFGRRGLIAMALLGKLHLEKEHELLNSLLPPIEDFLVELSLLHAWVLARLESGKVRWYAVSRYVDCVERFRRRFAFEAAKRRAGTNDDEQVFRDDLGAYLHDRGFQVVIEPLQGAGRPDVVGRHLSDDVDMPMELKVVRKSDTPGAIRSRLAVGMRQAVSYTHQSNCETGFLVLFWFGEVEPDLAPIARLASCTIHVFVVNLRAAPSRGKGKGKGKVQVVDWAAIMAVDSDLLAVSETRPL